MLGQSAQAWSGTLADDITGDTWSLHMTFSNLDTLASDGLTGPTTVEIVVTAHAL